MARSRQFREISEGQGGVVVRTRKPSGLLVDSGAVQRQFVHRRDQPSRAQLCEMLAEAAARTAEMPVDDEETEQ